MMHKKRCAWCNNDPVYIAYHDNEWGVPLYDNQQLFELLILEGMQAGLSWITILKRRDGYRKAFNQFNPRKIATFNETKVQALLQDKAIIRNELKIRSIINNAKCYLAMQDQGINFSDYLWQFVDGVPIKNHFKSIKGVPSKTTLSDAMSADLKKRGFKFVGSTICYAFMQAAGLVNDHTADCFLYQD